jgi:hypothetical protein
MKRQPDDLIMIDGVLFFLKDRAADATIRSWDEPFHWPPAPPLPYEIPEPPRELKRPLKLRRSVTYWLHPDKESLNNGIDPALALAFEKHKSKVVEYKRFMANVKAWVETRGDERLYNGVDPALLKMVKQRMVEKQWDDVLAARYKDHDPREWLSFMANNHSKLGAHYYTTLDKIERRRNRP